MEPLQRFLIQFRTLWGTFSVLRRAAIVVAALLVFAAVGTISYLYQGGNYKAVYTNLSPEEAGKIKAKLDGLAITYKLSDDGSAILVPADKVANTVVTLAADGITTKGGKGYELFDETSIGMTPFVQNVNYQRALQAELGRSIMQIEPVSYARVLIARPESTPFIRDRQAPTASVVLKLKPNATLSRAAANSITSLVSRSVEGLKPENVTVVDSTGRQLTDPNAGDRDDVPASHLEYRRELEAHLAAKAEEMLARHLGPGRAIVRVSADLNYQKIKERKETYSPEERAVAAERLTTTSTSGTGGARGVTGVSSNTGRAGGTTGGSSGGGSNSKEEVIQTDYFVSKSTREMEDKLGAVQRLTIAVMADLTTPEGGTQVIALADAQEIVKQAIGFKTGRDEIKVSNVRMAITAPLADLDEESAQLLRVQAYVSLARNVSVAVATVMALVIAALLLFRRRTSVAPAAEAPAPPPAGVDEVNLQTDAEFRQTQQARFADLARTDPDKVAAVLGLLLAEPAR